MDTTTTPILARAPGKHGLLRLSFELRGSGTVLAERYWRSPFGAVRANHPDDTGVPEVQITNPSGGILGGDWLEMEISVASGSSATVLTQAANKAYRGDAAVQEATFAVGEGAFLEYLPHHLIPYAGSKHRQETTFDLAPGATLITWDAYSAGRVARGERFAFDRLSAKTRISIDGFPLVMDGFGLTGGAEHFGGYSYVAAVYIVAPKDFKELADELHESLVSMPGVLASASAPADGFCSVRTLTEEAHDLYHSLNSVRRLVRGHLGFPIPAREVI